MQAFFFHFHAFVIVVIALYLIGLEGVIVPISFMYYKVSSSERYLVNYRCSSSSGTIPVYSGTVYGQFSLGHSINYLPDATELLEIPATSLSSCSFSLFSTDEPSNLLAYYTYDGNITSYSISVFAARISYSTQTGYSPTMFAYDNLQHREGNYDLFAWFSGINLLFTDPIATCDDEIASDTGAMMGFVISTSYTSGKSSINETATGSFGETTGSPTLAPLFSRPPTLVPSTSQGVPSAIPTAIRTVYPTNMPQIVPTFKPSPNLPVPTNSPNSPTVSPVSFNQTASPCSLMKTSRLSLV